MPIRSGAQQPALVDPPAAARGEIIRGTRLEPGCLALPPKALRKIAFAAAWARLPCGREDLPAAKRRLQSPSELQVMDVPFEGYRMHIQLRPWLHYTAAQVLSAFRLNRMAIDEFKAAIACSPGYADAWRSMGFLHGQLGNTDASVQCLKEALRIDPSDDVTRFNLGFIYHGIHHYQDAIVEFEQVVGTSPNNDRAWYGLGLCREQIGEREKAVGALKKAAKLQYFNPHAGYHLALLYHKLGEHEKALAEYERVKSYDPKFAEQIRRETGVA